MLEDGEQRIVPQHTFEHFAFTQLAIPIMSQPTESTVLTHVSDNVAYIVMNRPRKGNAFNPDMIISMHESFDKALRDPEVRVIVLTGNGKYFCTGMDLGAKNQVGSTQFCG